MELRDDLPPGCPPEGHEVVNIGRVVYRLVEHDPPQTKDFLNSHERYPNRLWRNDPDPCHLRAVSVWDTVEGCRSVHTRGPLRIVRLDLHVGSGAIMPYGSRLGHFSWWPSRDFDISANTEIVVYEEES